MPVICILSVLLFIIVPVCLWLSLRWMCPPCSDAGVCVCVCMCAYVCNKCVQTKTTHFRRRTFGQIGFRNTKSGAGEQSMLEDCLAKVRAKGMFFHIHTHRRLQLSAPLSRCNSLFECPPGANSNQATYLLTPPVQNRSMTLAPSARRTTSAEAKITALSMLACHLGTRRGIAQWSRMHEAACSARASSVRRPVAPSRPYDSRVSGSTCGPYRSNFSLVLRLVVLVRGHLDLSHA